MTFDFLLRNITLFAVAGLFAVSPGKHTKNATERVPADPEKELYLPVKVWRVPDSNDYNNNESEFSYQRMVKSPISRSSGQKNMATIRQLILRQLNASTSRML